MKVSAQDLGQLQPLRQALMACDGHDLACPPPPPRFVAHRCGQAGALAAGASDRNSGELPSAEQSTRLTSWKMCWHGDSCPWHARSSCLWQHSAPAQRLPSVEGTPDSTLAATVALLGSKLAAAERTVLSFDVRFAKVLGGEVLELTSIIDARVSSLSSSLVAKLALVDGDLRSQLAQLQMEVLSLKSEIVLARSAAPAVPLLLAASLGSQETPSARQEPKTSLGAVEALADVLVPALPVSAAPAEVGPPLDSTARPAVGTPTDSAAFDSWRELGTSLLNLLEEETSLSSQLSVLQEAFRYAAEGADERRLQCQMASLSKRIGEIESLQMETSSKRIALIKCELSFVDCQVLVSAANEPKSDLKFISQGKGWFLGS